ncbi:nuclear transport factor 2 family protein [Rhodococcus sp. AG1013]|uniref:nuclear transport factor 2 family protein n=1 Tax=unclassified Rhodococcus (in: high G+C Gram-positive bacteria) TaxID=192944 RepID=UPI000E0A9849|nr:nuclear transport factor 2 family protein [Rhodococcus sp. AG1013]RDI19467.1 3-phenylpropionate/cinnamic acid dioxygenase small subunit [Rhodococcus sp. AG1013]
MSGTGNGEVGAVAFVEIHQLYGRQSHLIDEGFAAEWAATFTETGEFHSPSYPAPVVGTAALTEFARAFFTAASTAGEAHRHVLTNILIDRIGEDELAVRAYLQIIATRIGGDSRLVRFTTVTDRVVRAGGQWRIARRAVRRDDSGGSGAGGDTAA